MQKLLILIACVSFFALANWPWSLSEVHTEIAGNSINTMGLAASNATYLLTTAGWPITFYQKSGLPEDPVTTFSWLALLGNVCVWAVAGILLRGYYLVTRKSVFRQNQEIDSEFSTPNGQVEEAEKAAVKKGNDLRLADLFLITAVCAAVFGYWQLLKSRRAEADVLAAEVTKTGGCVKFVARLPSWLESFTFLHSPCARVGEVKLRGSSDQILETVVQQPYLNVLNIVGGQNDLSKLDQLSTKPMFAELAVVGRTLEHSALQSISNISSLRSLNLMRTNITAKGISKMGLPRLQKLNLIHTDIKLAELNELQFAKTLRVLSIPCPPRGYGDSFRIESWPELEELNCFEYDEPMNSEPMSLTLGDLPKLKTLRLELLQLFDLELENLPKLSKIELSSNLWERRASINHVVPSTVWIRNLKVRAVPQLQEVEFFAANAKSIDIQQDTPMRLKLGVRDKNFDRNNSQYARNAMLGIAPNSRNNTAMPLGFLDSTKIVKETRQSWINSLALSKSIESLDISSTPLNGLDLAPLTKNTSIKRLAMGYSALQPAQLSGLVGMEQLEELSLEGLHLDGRNIEWLAKTFPNLRKIVSERSVRRLRLEGIPNLESAFEKPRTNNMSNYGIHFGNHEPLEALKISAMPKLRDKFRSDVPMILVHVEAAPSLRGLSFQYPLPEGNVLTGLRDLEYFHAGGATCSDDVVREVCNCRNLKRLTLAYSSASAESLSRIAELRQLEYLVLTGSAANDQLVASLGQLSQLKTLRLDGTQVSEASASLVANLKQLQDLSLGDQKFSASAVSQLLTLSELRSLNLSGSEITSEHLAALGKLNELLILDLSRTELSNEQLEILSNNKPPKLVELKLNHTKLGAKGFATLVKQVPTTVRFALAGTEVNPNVMDWLVSQNRVSEYAGADGSVTTTYSNGQIITIRRSSSGSSLTTRSWGSSEASPQPSAEGDIDPKLFSPRQSEYDPGMDMPGMGNNVDDPGAMSSSSWNPIERLGAELFKLKNWGNPAPKSK